MVKLRAPLLTALTLLAAAVAAAPAAAAAPCANPAQVRVLSSGHGVLESIAIDSRGRLFFTDSTAGELLMLRRPGGRPKLILDGIDGPGGIVFQRHSGNVLVGFGDTIAQAADGPLNPEAGLLRVNPTTGASEIHTEGLQMANGVARGPGRRIYASIDIGGGIDRIRKRRVRINWADVPSANGIGMKYGSESRTRWMRPAMKWPISWTSRIVMSVAEYGTPARTTSRSPGSSMPARACAL